MHDTTPAERVPRLVATAPVPTSAMRAWAELHDRPLNFDPVGFDAAGRDPDWHVDHRRGRLGDEAPGEPEPDGPFELARQLLVAYEFADPHIVRAVYDADAPLEGRDMLLVGRFVGLRFLMPVRVGGVVDGPAEVDGRRIHRFGWHYRTLEGHLERGQMDYELRKDLTTGTIELALRAYSQRGDTNPIVRMGFRLFGRWMQRRFHDGVIARMQRLVAADPAGRQRRTNH